MRRSYQGDCWIAIFRAINQLSISTRKSLPVSDFVGVITLRDIKVRRDTRVPSGAKLVNRRKGNVASRRVAADGGAVRGDAMANATAKLLIFPRKTLAARYVVPSTSRDRRRGGAKLKFMRRRAFSRPRVSAGSAGRPAGRSARNEGRRRRRRRTLPRE